MLGFPRTTRREAIRLPPPRPRERGASLVELVVLMTVLSAAAAASIRSLESGSRVAHRVAAERLARDLRHAQRLSMSRLGTCGVVVDAAGESWRVYENGNAADPARHPATGFDHVTLLDSGEFEGVRVGIAVFGLSSGVSFDVEGRPNTGGVVTLVGPDGETVTVTVLPSTGLVRISP